jgi:formylglycine-generating enzyme
MRRFSSIAVLAFVMIALMARAEIAKAVTIDMVSVGNPGNAGEQNRLSNGDTNYYGAVNYTYSIGKTEINGGQYTAFLNAVAGTSDTYGLYNSSMASTQYGARITKSGSVYTAALPNEPVNYVSWGDAARFCNWLQNGQKTSAQDPLTTENGSYTLGGHTDAIYLMNVSRNAGATYVIPTENEWYKSTYYDPNKGGQGISGYWTYPTKSDSPPTNNYPSLSTNNANYWNGSYALNVPPYTTEVGTFANSLSAYGTLDQGGNVWEWNETANGGAWRGVRGGSFMMLSDYMRSSFRDNYYPTSETQDVGFRVAMVPEPNSPAMLLAAAIGVLLFWRRRS